MFQNKGERKKIIEKLNSCFMVLLSLEWTNLVPLRQVLWLKPRSGYRQRYWTSRWAWHPASGLAIISNTHTHTQSLAFARYSSFVRTMQPTTQQHSVLSIAEHRIQIRKMQKNEQTKWNEWALTEQRKPWTELKLYSCWKMRWDNRRNMKMTN